MRTPTINCVRGFLLIGCLFFQIAGRGAEVRLAIDDSGLLSWNSDSITTNTPYLHYEFQVETSPDLLGWTNFGSQVPGGLLTNRSFTYSVAVPPTNRFAFY